MSFSPKMPERNDSNLVVVDCFLDGLLSPLEVGHELGEFEEQVEGEGVPSAGQMLADVFSIFGGGIRTGDGDGTTTRRDRRQHVLHGEDGLVGELVHQARGTVPRQPPKNTGWEGDEEVEAHS